MQNDFLKIASEVAQPFCARDVTVLENEAKSLAAGEVAGWHVLRRPRDRFCDGDFDRRVLRIRKPAQRNRHRSGLPVDDAAGIDVLNELGKRFPFLGDAIPDRGQLAEEAHFEFAHDQILNLFDRIDVARFPRARTERVLRMPVGSTRRGNVVEHGQFGRFVHPHGKGAATHGAMVIHAAVRHAQRMVLIRGTFLQKAASRDAGEQSTFLMPQANDERRFGFVREMKMRSMLTRDVTVGIGPAAAEVPKGEVQCRFQADDVGSGDGDGKSPATSGMASIANSHRALSIRADLLASSNNASSDPVALPGDLSIESSDAIDRDDFANYDVFLQTADFNEAAPQGKVLNAEFRGVKTRSDAGNPSEFHRISFGDPISEKLEENSSDADRFA